MLDSLSSQTPLPSPAPGGLAAGEELGPLVGRRIRGYELVGLIGEGPAGAVYRARNDAGKTVAIKVFHRELSRPPIIVALTDLFTRLSDLDSPDLITVSDSGITPDGAFFYISPLVEGIDLATYVEKQRLAPDRALKLGLQICHALGEAHQAGIVHGGLKPKNVFVSADGKTVWIVDFGVSRIAGSLDQGVILGDPSYMAPEQFGGRADASSDVYAVGVLLYWLLSGELPFAGEGHGRIMMRQLSEKPQPPAGVEARVADVVLRALSKDPEARYASLAELGDALRGHERLQGGLLGKSKQTKATVTTPAVSETTAVQAEPAAPVEDLYPVGEERATEVSLPGDTYQAEAQFEAAPAAPGHTIPITKLEVEEVEQSLASRAGSSTLPPVPPKAPAGDHDETSPATALPRPAAPSPSMEASLEDFISQANASFPSTDGWDLHTGDVELIDDGDDDNEVERAAPPAPVAAKPATKPEVAAFKTPYGGAAAAPKGTPAPRTTKPTPKGIKPMPTVEIKPGIAVLPVAPAPAPAPKTPVAVAQPAAPAKPSRPTKLELGVAKAAPAAPAPAAPVEARGAKSRRNPFASIDDSDEVRAAPKAPLAVPSSGKRRNPFAETPDEELPPVALPKANAALSAVDTAEKSDEFPKIERRKRAAVAPSAGPGAERRRSWAKNAFSRDIEDAPTETELSGPFQKEDPTETLSSGSRATAMAPAPLQNRWVMLGAIGGAFAIGAIIVSLAFGGKPKVKEVVVAPAPAPAPAAPVAAAPAAVAPAATGSAPATAVAAAAPTTAAPTEIKPVIPAPQPIVTALPPDPESAPAPVKRHIAHRAGARPAAVAKAPKAAPKPVAVAKTSKKSGKAQKSGDWVDPFSE